MAVNIYRLRISRQQDVMEFLKKHNFFISLAHPFQYKFSDEDLNALISHLIELGLTV